MTAGIFRDRYGIPHLRGTSAAEVAGLQGRVAAVDRGWQLEWNRRRAEGRTAEVVGPAGLDFDRFARTARIEDTARRSYQRLDPQTRDFVDSYVYGVNAGLAAGSDADELRALRVTPEPWQPWTPLAVFAVLHLLFGGFADKLWRRHVAQRLGPDAIEWLAAESAATPGSNAWGVAGARTATGHPMIAGDPHRTADYPGVYHQLRLRCEPTAGGEPGFDVFGFSFPGVPGIQHFGHAGSVAWAITNAGANYQDLYLEDIRPDGEELLARGPHGWEPVRRGTEMIMVAGAEPEPVQLLETARGPVIIDQPGLVISLRTPSRVLSDLGFGALLPLLRASTVDDVESALRHWVEPVNSAVVADRSGALRHLVPGRVPQRDSRNLDLPVPGWDPAHAWTGAYVPMPVEPDRDLIANANDRASGGGLGRYYVPPWRAARIRELLGEGPVPAARMPEIHRDCRSEPAVRAQRLLAGVVASGPADQLRRQILDWDAVMAADSRPALLFAAWRHALLRWMAEQPGLAALADPEPVPEVFGSAMEVDARLSAGFDAICSHADQFGIDLAAGAIVALQVVAADPPPGVWGEEHRLVPVHGLAGLADGIVPELPHPRLAGDVHCVRATASTPGVTDRCSFGSMARYFWDLADPANSAWVVPFGASGRPGDRHAFDQTTAWAAGELLPVITDWAELTPEPPQSP